LAEDFLAIQTIVFLSQFFMMLRRLALSLVWGAALLLLAAASYPFQPEAIILYVLFGLLILVGGAILWVLIQMNRNEIISRITRSTPNKFDFNLDFVLGFAQYVGPILILMIAQLSGGLRRIIEPFLELVR
jgi:uncharacterized protein YhhL (DUF1145 family)